MKTAALLRSGGAALRRSAAPSHSHQLGRSHHSYSTATASQSHSHSQPERKVAILGAAGGIGQPLALLMKLNPLVSSLSLYDIANTPGVAADVSHINSPAQVVSILLINFDNIYGSSWYSLSIYLYGSPEVFNFLGVSVNLLGWGVCRWRTTR